MILSCSGTLGTCCTDGGIVVLVDMTKRVFDIIQIVIPILLIIWATWGFVQLVMDPEAKNGTKKIINRFIAAIVVFLLPAFVNFTLGLMPETFSLGACWKQSKNKAEVARQNSTYKNPNGNDAKTTPIYPNPDNYEASTPSTSSSAAASSNLGIRTDGTVHGEDVAAYALKFVGGGFKWGGRWNGELPYKPTTCIGFIEGIYLHFGIKVDWTEDTRKYLNNPAKYTVVTNAPKRPGDIVVYKGHYAMLTGRGNEMVHAAGVKYGVITSKDYHKCVKKLLGVVRVNGVV